MYKNTLRPCVRHGVSEPLLAILPIVGAIYTSRYERDCQLAFVEDGVEITTQEVVTSLAPQGWPTLVEMADDLAQEGIEVFACRDCASVRGVGTVGSGISNIDWVEQADLRLPLHHCRSVIGTANIVTEADQLRDQATFDAEVGKTTRGAYRGRR